MPTGLPARASAIAHQSVGAAFGVSAKITAAGQPAIGAAVRDASTAAFLHGLSIGCLVAGGVAAGGAILAALFLPAQPASQAAEPATQDVLDRVPA